MMDWAKKHCRSCEGKIPALTQDQIKEYIKTIPGWSYDDGFLKRNFEFKNFYEVMSFANAVAWIANDENHHPDLELGYKRCVVKYMTHSVKGISENDFISAAKVGALIG